MFFMPPIYIVYQFSLEEYINLFPVTCSFRKTTAYLQYSNNYVTLFDTFLCI